MLYWLSVTLYYVAYLHSKFSTKDILQIPYCFHILLELLQVINTWEHLGQTELVTAMKSERKT